MKKVRLLPRLLFLTLLAVVVASVMTAAIYSSVGPKTFANERVKELQLSAEVVSTYYVQYQSGEITLREFERALSMSGVITDSQMQVFNAEGKLIMRSTDDRPSSFVLKGQSDNILQLIRGGVQEVIEQGYPIIEEHVLNDEIDKICTVITPIYHSDDLIAVVALTMPESEIRASFNGLIPVLFLSMLVASIVVIIPVYFLARHITKPIRQMQDVAVAMAGGDFSVRADEMAGGEIGTLATQLNVLSEQLSVTISALTVERNRLRQTLNGLAEGIMATDVHLQITHTNPALYQLLEVESDFNEWGSLPYATELMHAYQQCMQNKEDVQMSLRIGANIIGVTIHPLISDTERCVGAVALFRDITQAERLEQTRKDYVANVSHELRTPLSAVRGLTEALSDGLIKTEEDRARYYGYILHECLRLSRLIDDLLELSRLQSGTEAMEPAKLNVTELIEEMPMRYETLAEDKGIEFTTDLMENCPYTWANADRVEQILTILLDNAFKFTPPEGRVWIETQVQNRKILVRVKNSGDGIQPEDLPHVFERFYKADKAHTGGGTGLGLSIASEILQRMGESISVSSVPGQTTTFSFTLPVYDAEQHKAEEQD